MAQKHATGKDAGFNPEIVVTARSRAENLSDVPLAISAFNDEELQDRRVESLRDIATLTTGLTITDQGAEYRTRPIIRGMAQNNIFAGGDNNVATFLDGVYIANPSAVNISLLDLERVEVVKGPVSALYGRNSFAGAINYVTAKPGNGTSGRVYAGIGTDGLVEVDGNIAGELIPDVLSARVSGGYKTFDGTWKDKRYGSHLGGFEKKGGQLALQFTPPGSFEASLIAIYADDIFDPVAQPSYVSNCASNGTVNIMVCGKIPDGKDLPYPQNPKTAFRQTANDRKFYLTNLTMKYRFSGLILESLTGYSDTKARAYQSYEGDYIGRTYPLVPGPGTINLNAFFGNGYNNEDFSQEVRLSSDGAGSFRWSVGGFYYHSKGEEFTNFGIDITPVPAGQRAGGFFPPIFGTLGGQPSQNSTIADLATRQLSAFGSAEADLLDSLTARAELRYSDERKNYQVRKLNLAPGRTDFPYLEGKWGDWSTRLSLTYRPTENITLYATAANGTLTGGFNRSATHPDDVTFGPEKNWTYEVGTKLFLLDRRLTINAAAFHTDWKNLQLYAPATDSATNPTNLYKNFGAAKVTGFEAEANAVLASGFNVRAGLAYVDSRFADAYTADGPDVAACRILPQCSGRVTTYRGLAAVDLKGLQLPLTSKWQANLSTDFSGDLTNSTSWMATVTYGYQSKQYMEINNLFWIGTRHSLNVVAGIDYGSLKLRVWGKNLLDDTTPDFAWRTVQLNDFSRRPFAKLGNRRQFGVSAAYSF